jgi:hypothetical protein
MVGGKQDLLLVADEFDETGPVDLHGCGSRFGSRGLLGVIVCGHAVWGCTALSGLIWPLALSPGALPRAGMLRPLQGNTRADFGVRVVVSVRVGVSRFRPHGRSGVWLLRRDAFVQGGCRRNRSVRCLEVSSQEVDFDQLSVEVALEIEEEDFEFQSAFVEGGIGAQADGGGDGLPLRRTRVRRRCLRREAGWAPCRHWPWESERGSHGPLRGRPCRGRGRVRSAWRRLLDTSLGQTLAGP